MLDNNLNSNIEEVVHPQEMNSNKEEVVHPQDVLTPEDIMNMSGDEFSAYLDDSAPVPDEDTAADDVGESTTSADDDNGASDVSDSAEDVSGAAVEVTPDTAKPFKVFNSEDEYNAEINSAFRSRMKNHNDIKGKYDRMKNMASVYYPDSEDPVDTLMSDMESQIAERNNIPVEEYRSRENDRRDAELYREQQKAQDNAFAKQQEIINGWQRDAEQLKNINPEFDLKKAINNPEFANMLTQGKSVFEAYASLHKPKPPKQAERKEIVQNGAGRNRGTGNRSEVNPASLSSADFKKFIDNCRNA